MHTTAVQITAKHSPAQPAQTPHTAEDDGWLLPGRILRNLLADEEADVGAQPRHEGCDRGTQERMSGAVRRWAAKAGARARSLATRLLPAVPTMAPNKAALSANSQQVCQVPRSHPRVPGVMQLESKRVSGSGTGSPRRCAASIAS